MNEQNRQQPSHRKPIATQTVNVFTVVRGRQWRSQAVVWVSVEHRKPEYRNTDTRPFTQVTQIQARSRRLKRATQTVNSTSSSGDAHIGPSMWRAASGSNERSRQYLVRGAKRDLRGRPSRKWPLSRPRLSHGCIVPLRRRAVTVIERSVEPKDRRGAQRGRRTSPHARTSDHVKRFGAIFFGGYIHH